MRPGLVRPTAGYLLKVSLSAPELLCRAGRKCGHQLVLSVLLLPGGDGEDDATLILAGASSSSARVVVVSLGLATAVVLWSVADPLVIFGLCPNRST